MRFYLDPVFLSVKDDAWEDYKYAEIFSSFKKFLDKFNEMESGLYAKYNLFKIRINEELLSSIYQFNPFRDVPKIFSDYPRRFKNEILPELYNRIILCPLEDEECKKQRTIPMDIPPEISNDLIPDEAIESFGKLLILCANCGNISPRVIFTPGKFCTIDKHDGFFDEIIFNENEMEKLIDFEAIFPDMSSPYREEILEASIKVCYRKKIIERIWEERKRKNFTFSDPFWRSLERNNIERETGRFKERFIDCLTQVIYNRDDNVRIHNHGRNNQIVIRRRRYTRWSADIYKMGEGMQDNRCSRIFYYKKGNSTVFHEYDPDFHRGE